MEPVFAEHNFGGFRGFDSDREVYARKNLPRASLHARTLHEPQNVH